MVVAFVAVLAVVARITLAFLLAAILGIAPVAVFILIVVIADILVGMARVFILDLGRSLRDKRT
jgi:hypothetical protein